MAASLRPPFGTHPIVTSHDSPSVNGRDLYAGGRQSLAMHALHSMHRLRVQVIGAILFGAVLPLLFTLHGNEQGSMSPASLATAIQSFLAIVPAVYMLRRIAALPGAHCGFLYVACCTAVHFTALALLFQIVGAAFLWEQLGLGLVLVTGWLTLAHALPVRVGRPRFALLPFGNTPQLLDMPQADWAVAQSPEDALRFRSGVVVDPRSDLPDEWSRALGTAALRGVPVYHTKQLAEALTGRVDIEHLHENTLGSVLGAASYLRFQRLADLAFAAVAIWAIIPIGLVVALLIWREGGGPVLFTQDRMGFRGRVFRIYKFRTMRPARPGDDDSLYTSDNDRRVTRIGVFLRRYRLDELPQVINIFRGEMSWIGPRPEAVALARRYEANLPFYAYRHMVRPGISGWAQVNQGNVGGNEAAGRKLQYDFYYIKYLSPWLDLYIVARTFRTLLTGFGSR